MAGDFASQQPIVELHSGGFLGSYGDGLARWNLVPGGQLRLLLRHGVLAGGQVFDVDRPRAIGGEGFGIALTLHQESEALQHAVLRCLLNQQTTPGFNGDGLRLIVDIRMCGDFHPIGIESFKHHNGCSRQGASVQGVGKLHGAISGFGGELHLGGDFCIIHQQWLIHGLVHEYARNGIGLARGQAGVLHHIHNGDFAGGFSGVLAIYRSCGAQCRLLRLGDFHGLVFIVNIRVCGDFHLIGIEGFKHHNGGSRQGTGI